jgi:hypothetical protein
VKLIPNPWLFPFQTLLWLKLPQVAILPVCHLRRAAGSIGQSEARAGASDGSMLGIRRIRDMNEIYPRKKNDGVSQNDALPHGHSSGYDCDCPVDFWNTLCSEKPAI